jgi:IS5 family transposase
MSAPRSIAPWTRGGLLEAIATSAALARTATTDGESLHWRARRAELEEKAGALSERERETFAVILAQKLREYGGEEDAQ